MILRLLKIITPVLVLTGGAYGAWVLVDSRPQVETQTPEIIPPLVRTLTVEKKNLQLRVVAQGTVAPRTESALVPEVSGRVIFVSPSLATGAFFEEGEVLLRIEPQDFELAVVRASAEVARSQYRLEIEKAEAEVAKKEWQSLGTGEPNPLVLRVPQLAEARAALESARAALKQAERDLERATLRAPYTGRVKEENIDVGQYVARGAPVARLYSVDIAEVRLPVPDDQLAFVDLPLSYRGASEFGKGPKVVLTTDFAGGSYRWTGRIVRTEGEIDPKSRMVHAIAEVEDPYADVRGRPPLAVGLFVRAEIFGKWVKNVATIPRSALRGTDQVLIVSNESTLEFRTVEILRKQDEEVLIKSGVEEGERICTSQLDTVVEGMKVRTEGEEISALVVEAREMER